VHTLHAATWHKNPDQCRVDVGRQNIGAKSRGRPRTNWIDDILKKRLWCERDYSELM